MRHALLATTILTLAIPAMARSADIPYPMPHTVPAVTPLTLKPGDGQYLKDKTGNIFTISDDGHVLQNNKRVPGGGGTADLTIRNGTVYGRDNGDKDNDSPNPGGWFSLDGENWTSLEQANPSTQAPEATPSQAAVPPEVSQPDTTPPYAPVAQDPAAGGDCPAATVAGGGFHVANGQIQGPNGVYVARGVNLYGNDMGASQDGALIIKTFPGTNFIRFIARPLNDPGSYDTFVNAMTTHGTVVEFEDHPDGGGAQGTVYTGARLAAESAWYASMAAHFKSNPYVWFGTYNEPPTTGGSLSAWQQGTYDAIRSTGNQNPILVEVSGSRPQNLQSALDPGAYASMTNIVWDVHVYPYQNNGSSDPISIKDNIKGMIAAAQKIRSADGLVPVIIGESGPSTTGSSRDPNGYATVEGLINTASQDGIGHVPFVWGPGFQTPNSLTDMAGNPTPSYGQPVQLFINTDVVPPTKCQQNQQALQAITKASGVDGATPSQTNVLTSMATAPTATNVQQHLAETETLIKQAEAANDPKEVAAIMAKADAELAAAQAAIAGDKP